jgi:putative mRNA 3-end processing factor
VAGCATSSRGLASGWAPWQKWEKADGREEALKHWCMTHQIKACELNLVGYEDEDD